MNHSIIAQYNLRVPMRDGVTLSADVFRPAETKQDARVPVILVRTPYNKNQKSYIEPARYFAERGYAYVTMDVRGRGDSDGEFVPYRHEGRDGHDAVEWCAAQTWSNGNVGTLGASYLGRIQWLTALEMARHHPPPNNALALESQAGDVAPPEHLKTMIVMVTPSDPFVETPTGVPGLQHLCWLYLVNGRLRQPMEEINWDPIYAHLPLATMDERAGFASPRWREELKHQTLDAYWQAWCYQNKFDQINLPILHISGWYDDEQIGTPLNFTGMTTRGATEFARTHQKLLMGSWGHNVNATQKLGEVDFGADALIDLRGYELRWFDAWLKNQDDGITREPAARIFVMGENKWRAEHEFPLARTQYTNFYLHSDGNANSRYGDGALSLEAPRTEKTDRYLYDPARPTPYITDATSSQIGGPDDYAAVQQRGDVLVYVTAPLEKNVEVVGPVRVTLYAASSARDTDFTALLFDAHPSGFRQRLCDGIVRARYREGMAHASLIEPHKVYEFNIDVWYTAHVFFAGHRIGLQIASAAFPKYARNLNTGGDLATETEMVQAAQTIYHDTAHPSALVLPVIRTHLTQ
ncbi:MAG: CocE/NonD family hydrolase [Chloroflexi bacterium]|nr:CocE/NonD family hydrolase [Chloroflexota bacterium]